MKAELAALRDGQAAEAARAAKGLRLREALRERRSAAAPPS